MERNEKIKKIANDTGSSVEDINKQIEDKQKQLGDLVTEDSVVDIIAREKGVEFQKDTEDVNTEVVGKTEESSGSSNVVDLDVDDLGAKFIATPKVGESVEFTLDNIQKNFNIDAKDKEGKPFKTNLSSVDYKIDYIDVNGRRFSPQSWEVVGKINNIIKKFGTKKGVQLKIDHILDGFSRENRNKECYAVFAWVDGEWKELDRQTNEWKK